MRTRAQQTVDSTIHHHIIMLVSILSKAYCIRRVLSSFLRDPFVLDVPIIRKCDDTGTHVRCLATPVHRTSLCNKSCHYGHTHDNTSIYMSGAAARSRSIGNADTI